MKTLYLCMTLILLLFASAFSQTTYLNNRKYDKIDGKWYRVKGDLTI